MNCTANNDFYYAVAILNLRTWKVTTA